MHFKPYSPEAAAQSSLTRGIIERPFSSTNGLQMCVTDLQPNLSNPDSHRRKLGFAVQGSGERRTCFHKEIPHQKIHPTPGRFTHTTSKSH